MTIKDWLGVGSGTILTVLFGLTVWFMFVPEEANSAEIEQCVELVRKAQSEYKVYAGDEEIGSHTAAHKAEQTLVNALLAGRTGVHYYYTERVEGGILQRCLRAPGSTEVEPVEPIPEAVVYSTESADGLAANQSLKGAVLMDPETLYVGLTPPNADSYFIACCRSNKDGEIDGEMLEQHSVQKDSDSAVVAIDLSSTGSGYRELFYRYTVDGVQSGGHYAVFQIERTPAEESVTFSTESSAAAAAGGKLQGAVLADPETLYARLTPTDADRYVIACCKQRETSEVSSLMLEQHAVTSKLFPTPDIQVDISAMGTGHRELYYEYTKDGQHSGGVYTMFQIARQSPAEPEVSLDKAVLRWERPESRENGEVLTEDEIDHYTLIYFCEDQGENHGTLVDVPAGVYQKEITGIQGRGVCQFTVTATDTGGLTSGQSEVVSKDTGP